MAALITSPIPPQTIPKVSIKFMGLIEHRPCHDSEFGQVLG